MYSNAKEMTGDADTDQVVTTQPAPAAESSTPVDSALYCLDGLSQVVVKQQVRFCNGCVVPACCGACDSVESYYIRSPSGQNLLEARTDSSCLCSCCGLCQNDEIILEDPSKGVDVMSLSRIEGCPCMAKMFCGLLGQPKVVLSSPPGSGNIFGSIVTSRGLCRNRLVLRDANNEKKLYNVRLPSKCNYCRCTNFCCCFCCDDKGEFPIKERSGGAEVGRISKRWTGFSPGSSYSLNFNKDLPVQHKAAMLAAVFLIDRSSTFYDPAVARGGATGSSSTTGPQ